MEFSLKVVTILARVSGFDNLNLTGGQILWGKGNPEPDASHRL
jgi:hypothetical protein